MQNELEKATDLLSECLHNPDRTTPYNKARIDEAQAILLDLLISLKDQ